MPSWNLYPKNIVHSLPRIIFFRAHWQHGGLSGVVPGIGDPGFWAEAAEATLVS